MVGSSVQRDYGCDEMTDIVERTTVGMALEIESIRIENARLTEQLAECQAENKVLRVPLDMIQSLDPHKDSTTAWNVAFNKVSDALKGTGMTGNIVTLPVVTRLDLDADSTLENLRGKLEGFVLVAYDKEGNEFFSSTYADGGDALWLLERCKMALLNQGSD